MNSSNCTETLYPESPLELIIMAERLIPIQSYVLGLIIFSSIALYNFFEVHFVEDVFTGFRGNLVSLTYNSCSEIYKEVAAKCPSLHGRHLTTPWLSSPHIQTTFLSFFGNPPAFSYTRHKFILRDGGTIALDWLKHSDVLRDTSCIDSTVSKNDDTTPIMVVLPGLTSDSESAYIKHLVFEVVKQGWNVVVCNHRGLGGMSLTSDCLYNAGWTDDVWQVVDHLRQEFPKSVLFAVGTSLGVNILVKYLGEEGENTPLSGAAAVCSPWDLLIADRFIVRGLVQRLYNRALTIGLQGYAQLHESVLTRLANWEGITKSRMIREFDTHATCILGNFKTVDTFYRNCSSTSFVGDVSVPLLCISFLDDPLCTREAIPWDECRANKNVVLATTPHGGHLAFFQGITANRLWWAKAVGEFLSVLHSSPLYMHSRTYKTPSKSVYFAVESSIDQGPYVSPTEDGMASPETKQKNKFKKIKDMGTKQNEQDNNIKRKDVGTEWKEQENSDAPIDSNDTNINEHTASVQVVKRCIDQLIKQNKKTTWLLAYITFATTWPILRSLFRRRFKNF